jgi:L-arabinose isomerase
MDNPLRIGLFGIGLEVYWPQFAELKDRLETYLGRVAAKLRRPAVDVVNLGLLGNVFGRAGIPSYQITGVLDDDPQRWHEVDAWVEAAQVAAGMAANRLGPRDGLTASVE